MALRNSASALDALRSADLLAIGMAADETRSRLHPGGVVTYLLQPAAPDGSPAASGSPASAPSPDDPLPQPDEVFLPDLAEIERLSLDQLQARMDRHRGRRPGVTFHHLPVSARHACARDLSSMEDALPALEDAGLASFLLEIDAAAPEALPRARLRSLLRRAPGLPAFARLLIGRGESAEMRLQALELLRALEQECGTVLALQVAVHRSSDPGARREEEATAVDYLRTLAVARLYLDAVPHLQAGWSVMGPKVLELALKFGADDAGSVPDSQAAGREPSHHGGQSELRRILRDAGFRPVARDALFRRSLLH